MADGYRFAHQTPGNFFFAPQPRNQILRNGSPLNNARPAYAADIPSPARSPDSHIQSLYGMFSQGHQQGQHSRINGAPNGRGMPMMYNFQHQAGHQQHAQHHPSLQQDHSTHAANGNVLGHHSTFSGVLSNATPSFTPTNLPNGHSAIARAAQPQHITEHWAEQLQLYKDSQRAHAQMVEGHAPHHYARLKASQNRGITPAPPANTGAQDGDAESQGRNRKSEEFIKRQDWNNMDLSGQGLRVLSTALFRYTFLTELYVASNKIAYLPPTIGQLRFLRHLDASNNQLSQLPPELGMCVYLKNLLLFDNNIHMLPNEIGSLFQLEMLGIEGNPLDASVKHAIMEKGTKTVITELRESTPIPLPPNERPVIDLLEGAPIPANREKVRVFSYNILCDNATRSQYNYTPSEALSWDYRKEMILKEIQKADADIICLQEVDVDSFEEYFRMRLAYHDYKGVFWPKARAKTMSEKDRKVVDGCATFYRGSKYVLLDKQLVDFANLAINRPDMKSQHDIFNRVMPRDQMAIVTFFENRATGSRLIVANGHLFWDPAYPDVKLIQTAILTDSVTKLADKYARWPPCKDKKHYRISNGGGEEMQQTEMEPAPSMEYASKSQLPLLMCVDLNSTADSSVYELLSKGRVSPEHEDLAGFQYGNFTRDGIEHPFALRSAYNILDETPEKLNFTNYTPGFVGVIDHIFYSTNALEVASLLDGVDPEYMKRVPGFPNYHFPSDHLSLLADFVMKVPRKKQQEDNNKTGDTGNGNGELASGPSRWRN